DLFPEFGEFRGLAGSSFCQPTIERRRAHAMLGASHLRADTLGDARTDRLYIDSVEVAFATRLAVLRLAAWGICLASGLLLADSSGLLRGCLVELLTGGHGRPPFNADWISRPPNVVRGSPVWGFGSTDRSHQDPRLQGSWCRC